MAGISDVRHDLCLVARALERERPDPEGAHVRPHRAAGEPRRGRQGVLVVPRRAAEPRAAEVALPLPAGRVPVRRSSSTTAAGLQRPRAGAARHGRLRRRPLLGGRRHLRQGLADRGADADRAREPRAGRGDDRRAADALVPQHVVVGRRATRGRRIEGDGSALVVSEGTPRRLPARRRARPGRRGARGALLRERDERAARLRVGRDDALPEGRDQRPRRLGRGDRQPGGLRHEGRVPLPRDRRRRRQGRAAAQAAPAGRQEEAGRDLGRRRVRQGRRRARGRRRRVLRRARAGGHRRRAHADPPAGVRRARLEQADVPVQRAPLARRRPRVRGAARGAQARPQRRLAPPRLVRRARDAGPVGVPVVRGVGPRLPLHPVGAPRSRVREVPAARAAPRVVPAPERRAARVRVELRRRQPAGARHGRAARVRDRRRHRPRVPRADLPEAADQLHLVAQPRGRRRQQRLQRRLPRPRQHQPDRPLEPAGGRHARAGRRHGVDGLLRALDARDRDRAVRGERRLPRHGDQVPRAVLPHRPGARAAGPLRPRRRVLLRPARVPVGRVGAGEGADDLGPAPGAPGRRACRSARSNWPRDSASGSRGCARAGRRPAAPSSDGCARSATSGACSSP